jgi:nucleoside-diphosphate-sugar epimerase
MHADANQGEDPSVRSPVRILITGGSGFIGTNAVEHFHARGYEVLNLDQKPPANPAHQDFWRKCDVREAAELLAEVCRFVPDYVLHLAARTDLAETRNLSGYDANIRGVENVIEAIRRCGSVKRTIFASSRMVCRIAYQPVSETDYCPPNLYGESKVLGEKIVREANLKCEWLLVRPTSIWGPWFDVPYKTFFLTIARRMYVHPGKYDPLKSFGFVGNTVVQLDRLLHSSREVVNGKVLYLCDYPPLRLRHWAELIRVAMNRPSVPSVAYSVLRPVATVGDILQRMGWYRVPLTSFKLRNLITEMEYDTTLLRQVCGELPFDLETGVVRTIAWMREMGQIG